MHSKALNEHLQSSEIPALWRAAICIVAITLSFGFYRAFHLSDVIPGVLFIPLFPILMIFLLLVFSQCLDSPLIPFSCVFFIFMTVFIDSFSARSIGISPKSNQLSFALSLLFSGIYFVQDFKYYLRDRQVQLSLIFFIITFIYYFFYSSDFDISRVKYGYVLLITAGLEINSPPVRTILLISSLSILVASILILSPFRSLKTEFDKSRLHSLLQITYSILAYSLCFIMLCVLSKGAKFNYGMHYYLPLVLLAGCALSYLVGKYHQQDKAWLLPFNLGSVLNSSLIFSGLLMPLLLNKTSIFGTLLAFLLFFWLTRHCGYGAALQKIWGFASQGLLPKIILVSVFILSIVLGFTFGLFDLFSAKIDYVVSGLNNSSSMRVREGNWQYFLQNWQQSLNLQHILFGYGIGASRKMIFYISAMRNNPHESNLVQTLHNSYMEYIYDYGLLCLIYFGMYVQFLKRAIETLGNTANKDIYVLSSAQLGIVLYTAFYGLTDGIRVQMLVQIFVLLIFLEKLKQYYTAASTVSRLPDKIH